MFDVQEDPDPGFRRDDEWADAVEMSLLLSFAKTIGEVSENYFLFVAWCN